MFSTLSPGALGLSLDHPTSIDLAARHGFGGVDPDLGHLRSLGVQGAAEHGDAVRERGLQWGMAGLPVPLDAPAAEFRQALVDLPESLELLTAAGVDRVGTWIRPMHQELDHRQNWRLHQGRLSLVAQLLADAGIRLGLEYIGPKTLWSTERFPFIHSLREARELIAESGAGNVGLILDSYHWYTERESPQAAERRRPRLGRHQRCTRRPRARRAAGPGPAPALRPRSDRPGRLHGGDPGRRLQRAGQGRAVHEGAGRAAGR